MRVFAPHGLGLMHGATAVLGVVQFGALGPVGLALRLLGRQYGGRSELAYAFIRIYLFSVGRADGLLDRTLRAELEYLEELGLGFGGARADPFAHCVRASH